MSTRQWLTAVAVLVGSVVVLGIMSAGAWAMASHKTHTFATPETSEFTAYTSAENAIVVITNMGKSPLYWCGRGVVTNLTGARATSHIVCGEIASRTTVELRAPYRVGAIKDLCPSTEAFKLVDWDKCDFTAEPVR